jgi:alkylated DNA repair dioxygenase AlkB
VEGGKGTARLRQASVQGSIATYSSHHLNLEILPWQEAKSQGGKLTRKSCWFTTNGCSCPYQYGMGKRNFYHPEQMPPWMLTMANQLEEMLQLEKGFFNSCNANLYACSEHDLYWHSDDEPLFRIVDAPTSERNVLIVSVSLGSTRDFGIRQKLTGTEVTTPLSDGDILTMEGLMQENYLHCVKKAGSSQSGSSSSSNGADNIRYNLTFRRIQRHKKDCKGEDL